MASARGFDPFALTVAYGQLHRAELDAAKSVAAALAIENHQILKVDLATLAASALTREAIGVPMDRTLEEIGTREVPVTYVPARNTVLLSLALAWAETLGTQDIFLGVNVLDASGYPDCSAEFVRAFEALANIATAMGSGGRRVTIHAPLIEMTKAEIITEGIALGLDYGLTHSCYVPATDGGACGRCDACQLRRKGFEEAGVADPTRYSL